MKNIRKRWWILLFFIILLFIVDITMYTQIKEYYPDFIKPMENKTFTEPCLDKSQKAIQESLSTLSLNSEHIIVVDLEDMQTLYEKKADEKIYPASITKALTALVALDSIQDLNQKVTITKDDLAGLAEANASVAGLKVNEKVTYEDLLYALILPSGADGANALANNLAGSVSNFVSDMNKKTQALGMTNTHFENPTGLHDKNHYTTLHDLKKMIVHAWKNPAFRNILTSLTYKIPKTSQHPNGLTLENTLLFYSNNLKFDGGEIVGGKSGFTPEAGYCLLSIGKMEDGHPYMVISAKAKKTNTSYGNTEDALKIYSTIAKTST